MARHHGAGHMDDRAGAAVKSSRARFPAVPREFILHSHETDCNWSLWPSDISVYWALHVLARAGTF